jgi:glutamate-5-semialdehyde dehydrogenase
MISALESLAANTPIIFGGDKVTHVPAELAARFVAGDRLLVVQETGDLLHIPQAVHQIAAAAVGHATSAFAAMGAITDRQIGAFFDGFAAALEDEGIWSMIGEANARDVAEARARRRSTTRLLASETMRRGMIAGLRQWRDGPVQRGRVIERIDHEGWSVEQATAPLGVVGFVFEGRPNVFADAAGVIAGGNTVVFRIGSDALGTARAIAAHALAPALAAAGLPEGAASLVDSADRAAGWAMFADPRLALAVARGSGAAVAQLGAVARQSGTPVSLHGTGGAWLIADDSCDARRFAQAVENSLDRKVCNTLNVCCIVQSRAAELVPLFHAAVQRAGEALGHGAVVHEADDLAREWEWEDIPEVSLKIVKDLDEAIALFNRHSPQFIVSLIAEDPRAHAALYAGANAAFVGDGFTRWVDGQYALNRPELGLSNWQNGRLFARGGVLAGDGVFTVRTRMTQRDRALRR